MKTFEWTADMVVQDDVIDYNGTHYRVLEVIRFDGHPDVELVTTPRMPIGHEFFSPSSLVSVIDHG